ncbi:hypothetical protein C9Z24_27435 (plasmid) [Escherichia coli]|nr:hypothetical protein C9Z24_27435 [Escherichia coli]
MVLYVFIFLLKAILTLQFSILTYKNHSITFYLQGVDWMNDSDFHSLFIRETKSFHAHAGNKKY